LQPEFEIRNTISAEFVPRRPMIICYSEEEPPGIRIWDLGKKRLLSRLPGTSDIFDFSSDGTLLATATDDRRQVWERERPSVWDISDPAQPKRLFSSEKCHGSTGVFSPDGGTWAIWKRNDCAEFWDTRRAQKRFELADINDPSGYGRDGSFIVFS